MATRVRDTSNVDEFLRLIDSIERSVIEAGILSNAGGEILLIANVHEFGSNKMNIPERSFLRAGFDKYNRDIADLCDRLISRVINQEMSLDNALNAIGQFAVSKIQEYLTDLDSPPLKQATIDRKGSSKVLIDTGRLRDSITYRIRR